MFESKRLILRKLSIQDAPAMFTYRSDRVTNKYQSWIPETEADVKHFIEENIAAEPDIAGSWFQMAIMSKADGVLVGDLGLHFLACPKDTVELGCTLHKAHHGKGYATEALTRAIDFLFTQLQKRRITGSIDPRNKASENMLIRLGMRKEAHFKESYLWNGEWVDDVIYGLLQKEWEEKTKIKA